MRSQTSFGRTKKGMRPKVNGTKANAGAGADVPKADRGQTDRSLRVLHRLRGLLEAGATGIGGSCPQQPAPQGKAVELRPLLAPGGAADVDSSAGNQNSVRSISYNTPWHPRQYTARAKQGIPRAPSAHSSTKNHCRSCEPFNNRVNTVCTCIEMAE